MTTISQESGAISLSTKHTFMPTPAGHRLTAPAIAIEVRDDFKRADLPELNETLITVATDRAVAQVQAGTPLPLDATLSKGDGCRLEDLAERREQVRKLRDVLREADEAREKARHLVAELLLPFSRQAWFWIVGAVAIVTVLGIVAIQLLLAPSFSELLLRPFYESLEVADPGEASLAHADRLVLFAGAVLLGSKAVAVVASSGRLPKYAKVMLLGVALLFSACFAAVRGLSWAAIAVSGVEVALLLSYSLALLVVAHVLKENADRQEANEAAQARVVIEEARVARMKQELAEAQEAAAELTSAIAQREDAQRRLPLYEELARAAVKAEALITTTELISRASKAAYGHGPDQPENPKSTAGGAP